MGKGVVRPPIASQDQAGVDAPLAIIWPLSTLWRYPFWSQLRPIPPSVPTPRTHTNPHRHQAEVRALYHPSAAPEFPSHTHHLSSAPIQNPKTFPFPTSSASPFPRPLLYATQWYFMPPASAHADALSFLSSQSPQTWRIGSSCTYVTTGPLF